MSLRRSLLLVLGAWLAVACRTPGSGGRPGESPQAPAAAPEATAAVDAVPGLRPSAPLPRGSTVALPSIQVQVRELQRGAAAWRSLRAASGANQPPREGSEFLLVRLRVTGAHRTSWVGCKDFRVTGARRTVYFHGFQLPPEPALEAGGLEPGQTAEGWCVYSIPLTDRSLILMINEPDSRDAAGLRYLALDEGAAVAAEPDAAEIPADSAGESPGEAAPPGQEVVTHDWSVNAVEILRGDAARRLVETANPSNSPPSEGLEFVAVKLHARYRGRAGDPGLLSVSQFQTLGEDGRTYAKPIVFDLAPGLDRTLLPGGEHTGWAVFQVAPDDPGAVLRFEPYYPDQGQRYLALGR